MQKFPLKPHPPNIASSQSAQSENLKSSQKPIPFDCEEEISDISPESKPQIPSEPKILAWDIPSKDYITSLHSKSKSYPQIPIYYSSQAQITTTMRAILYDWMMEVCSELALKRETFHLSINYCDRYMSITPNVFKGIYQLIGITCMYIAAKVEEVHPPCLADWVLSADNGYGVEQVLEYEKIILKILNFHVFPVTCFNWTNWLMSMWDLFVDFHFGCMDGNSMQALRKFTTKKSKNDFDERMICFKLANQKAYRRFRESFQILDVILLHPESLNFDSKYLSAGLMYAMISKYFFESKYALLYYNGDCEDLTYLEQINDSYHIESSQTVQDLYENFICTCLEISSIEEIYPVVTFIQGFIDFPSNFDLPIVCKLKSKSSLESHYEDFLSYQTHNSHNLDFIQRLLSN